MSADTAPMTEPEYFQWFAESTDGLFQFVMARTIADALQLAQARFGKDVRIKKIFMVRQ